jgi:hypothetical protein
MKKEGENIETPKISKKINQADGMIVFDIFAY